MPGVGRSLPHFAGRLNPKFSTGWDDATLISDLPFQGGLGDAFLVMIGYVAINVTFGNIIDPMLQGRQFGISTLVVILSLVFWGWVWGPLGMLLSVPLTMVLKIALENTDDLRWIAVLLAKWPAEKARIEAEVATPPAGPI